MLCSVAHQIRRQLFASGHVERQHHRFTHVVVIQQAVFYFPQLNTETADFYLVVNPAYVLNQTIGALAYHIAGAVQPPAIIGKRISHKPLGGHAGALMVALRQSCTADIQLTRGALRHQGQPGVEDIRHPRADDLADGHTARALFQLLRRQAGQRHDHGFGGTIGIEKHLWRERRANPLQVLAGQRLATGDAHAHRQGLLLRRQPLCQLAAVAGGEAQNIDLLLADQLADLLRIPLPLRAQYHPRTTQQGHQQTFRRRIKID